MEIHMFVIIHIFSGDEFSSILGFVDNEKIQNINNCHHACLSYIVIALTLTDPMGKEQTLMNHVGIKQSVLTALVPSGIVQYGQRLKVIDTDEHINNQPTSCSPVRHNLDRQLCCGGFQTLSSSYTQSISESTTQTHSNSSCTHLYHK